MAGVTCTILLVGAVLGTNEGLEVSLSSIPTIQQLYLTLTVIRKSECPEKEKQE